MATRHIAERNPSTFHALIARDLVRLAAEAEGLDTWLSVHGGRYATRRIAYSLFGDNEDASIFNAAMTLELDRQLSAAA